MTHSRDYVLWTATHFNFLLIFSLELSQSSSVTVTQGSWNIFYCFHMDTPFCIFLLSYWWPVLIILLFRLLHIFDSLSKCIFTTFFCMKLHKFHVKVYSFSISEPSVVTFSLFFEGLSHKVPVTLLFCFQVDTPLCHFLLSHWWPILIVVLCGPSRFFLIPSVKLSHATCVTVTRGPYNVFLLFTSGHSTLLLPFESLMTHSHSSVGGLSHFFLIFSMELFHSACVTFTQGSYNVFSLFTSGHSTLLPPLSHCWHIFVIMLCGLPQIFLLFSQ